MADGTITQKLDKLFGGDMLVLTFTCTARADAATAQEE